MANLRRIVQSAKNLGKATLKALVPLLYRSYKANSSSYCPAKTEPPKKILLINPAHIGDLVISTSLIPILRSAYPSAEIGFVTGTWSKAVVQDHPDIMYTHQVDHWRLNRGKSSFINKWLRFRRTRKVSAREIRQLNYDVAIGIFPTNPDLFDVAWAAGVPTRIAFRGSFFAHLATKLVDDEDSPFVTQGARQARTMAALPIDPIHLKRRQGTLPHSDEASRQELCAILGVADVSAIKYTMIHMGAGSTVKELPKSYWRQVSEALSKRQVLLLFTGRGERENNNIKDVMQGLPNCINACDKLSWKGFVACVRYADKLYGVDSMAGHVAAAVGTKCVVAYSGTAGVARWRPDSPKAIVFTNHLWCAPCHRPTGCEEMTCIRGIAPLDLIGAVSERTKPT